MAQICFTEIVESTYGKKTNSFCVKVTLIRRFVGCSSSELSHKYVAMIHIRHNKTSERKENA